MSNEQHVIPVNDVVEHVPGDHCLCGPGPKNVTCEQGDGRVVVHHSLDGREATEREAS